MDGGAEWVVVGIGDDVWLEVLGASGSRLDVVFDQLYIVYLHLISCWIRTKAEGYTLIGVFYPDIRYLHCRPIAWVR